MQKKMNRKLVLSKETLRTLTQGEMFDVKGAQTGTICSNPTDTCETCFGCTATNRASICIC